MADPAFRGFVESTLDALLVFEGCKRGYLPKISRRLQDHEKKALVVSGAIFVFDEEETGIKRWTDGLSWSPSRTLGNFLVYRELDKKTTANAASTSASASMNKEEEDEPPIDRHSSNPNAATRLMGGLTSKSDPMDDANDLAPVPSTSTSRPPTLGPRQRSLSEVAGVLQLDRARERALVGSLTSSYRFRSDGLVKKTISLSGLHLVAYYRLDDVTSGRLRTPSSHAELMSLEVSPGFLTPSLFRMPPVVEVGLDGQVRYKAESDTPISPLTRSGSSQGFTTPNLNQVRAGASQFCGSIARCRPDVLFEKQSRPSTSDPYATHLTPNLGGRPPSRDYPAAPGSPRRGATATVRSANRFDPYGVGRYSPNANAYSSTSSYPFNHQVPPSQPSPNRSTFSPIGESTVENHRRESSGDTRPAAAQMVNEINGGQVTSRGGWHGQSSEQGQGQGLGPGSGYQDSANMRARASFAGENLAAAAYYRPRQAVSYGGSSTTSPNEATSSSAAVFAYNPPSTLPPGPLLRRASEGIPSNVYPHRATQHRPVSQQYQPTSTHADNVQELPAPTYDHFDSSGSFSSAPYAQSSNTGQHDLPYRPYSSRNAVQQMPHLSVALPARDSPIDPSPSTWDSLDLSSTSTAPVHDDERNPETAATSRSLQPRHESHGPYSAASLPAASASTYAYQAMNQPNGLVVGFQEKLQVPIHSEAPSTVGLYQSEDLYGQPSQAGSRPAAYRPPSQPQLPSGSSLGIHLAYPSDASSTSTPVSAEHLLPGGFQNGGWQQNPKFPEHAGAQTSAGWWTPGNQDCAEMFWQGQGATKKEYPQR